MNIKEVAKAAGVSVATISRVLNHPEQVQPQTKNNVLEVMKELNYQPNWFARGLNFGKTNTIALLVPGIDDHRFVDIMTGVETIALKKQHTVLLCNTHANAAEEAEYLKMVMARQVDGVILVSSQLDDAMVQTLISEDFPWVHVGKKAPGGCQNLCFINYEEGTYQMTVHLIKMGHTDIRLLVDEVPLAEMELITAGYRRALQEHGLTDRKVLKAEDSVQGGYLAAQKLLQNREIPPAIITISDDQALGFTKAAQDEHIDIPAAMALACLKDSQMCSIVSPPLTALELPSRRLGLVAARMLFDCIEGGEDLGGPQEIILQPKLKIRRSCGNSKPIYELFG